MMVTRIGTYHVDDPPEHGYLISREAELEFCPSDVGGYSERALRAIRDEEVEFVRKEYELDRDVPSPAHVRIAPVRSEETMRRLATTIDDLAQK